MHILSTLLLVPLFVALASLRNAYENGFVLVCAQFEQ